MARQAAIERASPTDRAFLAMGGRKVPEQFGVILRLDRAGGLDLAQARRQLDERIPAVPRLRQRLIRAPFGCGGPIWVDDPAFDICRHVRAVACPEPGDEPALLDTALSVIMTPLPWTAPLWAAVLVTGLDDGGVALVVVLHHVLADGIGGLAVLASLADGQPIADGSRFPRVGPTTAMLARDAFGARLLGLRRIQRSWRLLQASMGAGGGLRPPRAAQCSLNQQTGWRRSLTVVRADAAPLRTAAHLFGATVNDAILVAVAGALGRVLTARGESVDTIVIAVPVAGRRPVSGQALGNMVSPLLVPVQAVGDTPTRLAHVAARVLAHKAAASGPPPIAVLGWLFRPLAALGGYRYYMNHQHRLHTLVSHVRGPAEEVTISGSRVTAAIPVAVSDSGNITVYFDVLSYAGTITVTVITDPEHFPDRSALTDALRAELDQIAREHHPVRQSKSVAADDRD